MILLMFFGLILMQQASGVIYNLNVSQYARFPDVFALERLPHCLLSPGDTYCYVDAALVANETSPLLTLLQEFSLSKLTHFNHTIVHRGVCLTQTCREYLNNSSDLADVTEACLNDTFYKSHGLQTKVIRDKVFCTEYGESLDLDNADYAVAMVVMTLLALNMAGTVYDMLIHDGSDSLVARLLLCFSLRLNWRRLRMPSGDGSEPRLRSLKGLTGIKAGTAILVILGHSPVGNVLATNNPEYMEDMYYYPLFMTLINGTLIIQTFFGISGFLLAYNMMLLGEKRSVSWTMLPKAIIARWFRLTPLLAIVMAYVATWHRHIGSGPLWKSVVEVETLQCRQYWYYNILYVNNYVDNIDCMLHTWYLAADMQLSILGLLIFCLVASATVRKVCIITAAVAGLLAPAVVTILYNLYPVLIVTPEIALNLFMSDPTFHSLYTKSHTNMLIYAMGMGAALFVYHLQQKNFNVDKFKKYRVLYWLTIPFALLIVTLGGVFYIEGFEMPLLLRAAYASGIKLAMGSLICIVILGTIFRVETVYTSVLEWDGWAPIGRVAYGSYLAHLYVIRLAVGSNGDLQNGNLANFIINFLGVLCISFVVATILWMLVEAPFTEIVKMALKPRPPKEKKEKKFVSIMTIGSEVSKETINSKL